MAEPEQTKKSMGQLFHSQFSVCLFVVSQEYQSNLLIRANLFDYSADINQEIEAFLKRCLFSC